MVSFVGCGDMVGINLTSDFEVNNCREFEPDISGWLFHKTRYIWCDATNP